MQTTRTWDIFCKVIDNFGDIGVCWRLCLGLAERGQQVRLWVDDASALAWMAPGGAPGVQLRAWTDASPAIGVDTPAEVVIEAFGCEVNAAWIAHQSIAINVQATRTIDGFYEENTVGSHAPGSSAATAPLWINLEYLSAEPYAARSHGLPSPVMAGPARGMTKWFFYPGFSALTGGLLRGSEVAQRLADPLPQVAASAPPAAPSPSAPSPPTSHPITPLTISLFCYEPTALEPFLDQLAHAEPASELLVTAGRATRAVQQVITHKKTAKSLSPVHLQLSISYLPLLTQIQFDDLLQRCDLNFVRGEDSLVRALWAGKPFVWQIYPQSDGAHAAKLHAFLDWLQAPPDLRLFHQVWNGLSTAALPALNLPAWGAVALAARQRLLAQSDLVSQLLSFVESRQEGA
jgi:uncharacterized repeat protein (TIGR03837 family)